MSGSTMEKNPSRYLEKLQLETCKADQEDGRSAVCCMMLDSYLSSFPHLKHLLPSLLLVHSYHCRPRGG